ncbi:MAG: galactokinase [Nocardioidaceae bacterium]|nr:galactokinase [Nocardioidaceae bacterium]
MDLSDDFAARYDGRPTVIGSGPGRVNLIGEHLDYNGGRCLPIALAYRTEVAAAPRDDGRIAVETRQHDGRVVVEVAELDTPVEGWAGYVLGVVWALGLAGSGLSLLVDGRVPVGAGLSSSAALECATAMAVCEVAGVERSREDIVAASVRAENEYVGAATGSMDQTVAMFAEAGQALLIDFASDSKRLLPWNPPGDLVVVDTRASHELVGGEYADRRRSCEAAAAELGLEWLVEATADRVETLGDPVARRRARHVVTETTRVTDAVAAIEARDWEELGRLMTASHASLRDDYEVSCRELDVAVDAALAAGAWGARMTGGGFGGSAIALVPPGGADDVRGAVTAAYDAEGLRAPEFLDGAAGGPAEVSRPGR